MMENRATSCHDFATTAEDGSLLLTFTHFSQVHIHNKEMHNTMN